MGWSLDLKLAKPGLRQTVKLDEVLKATMMREGC
jgi:hypothetical protein